MGFKTSIIILTRNRSFLLQRGLQKLTPQLKRGDRVIVVNNGSIAEETRKIKRIVEGFRKISRGSFSLIKGDKNGSIPKGRNIGIRVAKQKSQIIAFLDDDCFVDKDWLKNTKEEHEAHQNWQVIQGKVFSLPRNNLYARITSLTYQNWLKANFLTKDTISTFDSKNVSFKAKVFRSGFLFNEEFNRSSDIELGLHLRKKGVKIGYSPKIRVYHRERITLIPFLKQHLNIAKGERRIKSVGYLPSRYKFHLISFTKLAFQLIREGALLSLFQFLLLIPVILILRLGVFLFRPWRYRS